jgi:hypothetical protein
MSCLYCCIWYMSLFWAFKVFLLSVFFSSIMYVGRLLFYFIIFGIHWVFPMCDSYPLNNLGNYQSLCLQIFFYNIFFLYYIWNSKLHFRTVATFCHVSVYLLIKKHLHSFASHQIIFINLTYFLLSSFYF